MTLGQLRTLLAVARAGSIRGAAAALVVSEPSVSAAVAALGRELGVPLTERAGRGIRLTEAGRVFADYAATMLGLADRGARAAREAAGRPGHVRVAAVTTAGEYVLPAVLAELLAAHDGLQVTIEVGNRAEVIARLLRQEADLGIGGRPPEGGELDGEAVMANPLVVVGRAGHPLGTGPAFDPRRLSGETWLLREPGSGTRQASEEFMAAAGIEPGSVMNVGSNGAITRAAELGLGVTLLAEAAVAAELAAGRLALLPAAGTPLPRSWYVLTRAGARLPASARLLVGALRAAGAGRRPRAGA
jgi:DNA-binding transcriptional LysR family regulator